ncbi:hypothetical protein IWQ60_012194 [Tieghemiomyces parasiticus]|uniref:Uncharacterized protein n=1 Tax=Tieghemiomyces parasiticus TaxID=78921 RepID=A0A9W8DKZ1_9FUNG|nr:hypothetical protein IWQ60_012194 [Tieghemiomyces parasiticus]
MVNTRDQLHPSQSPAPGLPTDTNMSAPPSSTQVTTEPAANNETGMAALITTENNIEVAGEKEEEEEVEIELPTAVVEALSMLRSDGQLDMASALQDINRAEKFMDELEIRLKKLDDNIALLSQDLLVEPKTENESESKA